MAKNSVQFQPGMSLPAFLAQYGSEAQCRGALIQQRWPQGFRCPDCGHAGHCRLKRREVFQCNRCKRQVSLTSGTLFAETKLPLRTWFLAIYLLTQNKNGISALSLRRHLGVSYNTAWLVKHKLMQAMVERDHDRPLSGRVQLDDAYWRTPRGQYRSRQSWQDALCGGGAMHAGWSPRQDADGRRGRVPQDRAVGLGSALPGTGQCGGVGWLELLPRDRGRRLHA